MGPFGFTGEVQDSTSNVLYLRARWYDPGQRTFTSRDPFAGFPETPYSLHPYQYGYSNPVLWTDATGQSPGVYVITGPAVGHCVAEYGVVVGAALVASGVWV
ncbi:MAG: hypothetical protein MI924_22075, partial [Chloroflexales bacterium]|nr:hypothetical protein [Chloroflexales bacterium]